MSCNKYEIRKLGDRFYCDFWSHEMVWDEKGIYLGQFQENAFDEGQIFLNASGDDNTRFALTDSQMKSKVFKLPD